jgi:hypothetical protein
MNATMEPALDTALLARLNRLSVTRSFTPQIDVDWTATTTDAEYESLYDCWSLLAGTGRDASLDASGRVRYVQYQQMNLMAFTGLLERHAIGALAGLYDLDPNDAFSEYVGHFIKEEIYHYAMFRQAVSTIQATIPDAEPLPTRAIERLLRLFFRLTGWVPGHKLRASITFILLSFAEQVTIYAHQMVQGRIPRRESLIHQVWGFHALDEARHLAFDAVILERNRLPRPIAWLPRALAAPWCLLLSLLLNANEIRIARRLGVKVSLWQLPGLMRRTRAPFKRRVFALLARTLSGREAHGKQEGP